MRLTLTVAAVVTLLGTASAPARAANCTRGAGGAPLVQVSGSPEALAFLKGAGLTEADVRDAASAGLAAGHVGCISENAIPYPKAMEDWVSVVITVAPKGSAQPLVIDMSVRNGPAVTNQRIRWQGRRSVGSVQREVLDAIRSLIKDLAAAYGSAEYRKGRAIE